MSDICLAMPHTYDIRIQKVLEDCSLQHNPSLSTIAFDWNRSWFLDRYQYLRFSTVYYARPQRIGVSAKLKRIQAGFDLLIYLKCSWYVSCRSRSRLHPTIQAEERVLVSYISFHRAVLTACWLLHLRCETIVDRESTFSSIRGSAKYHHAQECRYHITTTTLPLFRTFHAFFRIYTYIHSYNVGFNVPIAH